MKIIPAVLENEVFHPSESFPEDRIAVVFDGTNYIIYQTGDIISE